MLTIILNEKGEADFASDCTVIEGKLLWVISHLDILASKLAAFPSLKGSSNMAVKYVDCLQRRDFGSLYSWVVDPMRIVT